MSIHSTEFVDPYTQALTYLATADDHAASARLARRQDTPEAHKRAGLYREQERLALKRAEILAGLAQAHALADLADSGNRVALAQ